MHDRIYVKVTPNAAARQLIEDVSGWIRIKVLTSSALEVLDYKHIDRPHRENDRQK
jgi:hypothetical protein